MIFKKNKQCDKYKPKYYIKIFRNFQTKKWEAVIFHYGMSYTFLFRNKQIYYSWPKAAC